MSKSKHMSSQNRSRLTQILVIDEFFDDRANNVLELPGLATLLQHARDNLRDIIFDLHNGTFRNFVNIASISLIQTRRSSARTPVGQEKSLRVPFG